MTTTMTYTALEDNAGGLYLVVRDTAGHTVYLGTGYQYSYGERILSHCIAALKRGETPESWDDNMLYDRDLLELLRRIDTYDGYTPGTVEDADGDALPMTEDEVADFIGSLEIIADNLGIYPDRMGNAARAEFGVDD